MNQLPFIAIIFISLLGCSNNANEYNYIKILSIAKADTITEYNKGVGLYNYLYYNPKKDSAVFRFVQSVDPDTFDTYEGKFRNKDYADTISLLISLLKHHKEGVLPCTIDSNVNYCGPELYVEYNDSKGSHYSSFIIDNNDTLTNLSDFFHRLEELPWKKVLVSNDKIDETEEAVKMLKGLGTYNSMVKPYVPLPCKKGIKLEKIYGTWRTIGDKYNDATFQYWVNRIDTSGSWILEKVNYDEITRKYSGRIKSINKDYTVEVENENGIIILEILNLTENCFEYRDKESKKTSRLDRMK